MANYLIPLFPQLNDKVAEFEQEKFEMQKQHTQNIQELLDETNQRLQKMETEYNQQNATTVSTCMYSKLLMQTCDRFPKRHLLIKKCPDCPVAIVITSLPLYNIVLIL